MVSVRLCPLFLRPENLRFFSSLLLLPGCNAAVCPRFASSENCTGLSLICSGDNVIRLCVISAIPLLPHSPFVFDDSHRYLNNKQLTGSIPSSIGQLAALDTLCVVRLCISICRILLNFGLNPQVLEHQSIDRINSVIHWSIDGTLLFVRRSFDCLCISICLILMHFGFASLFADALTGTRTTINWPDQFRRPLVT